METLFAEPLRHLSRVIFLSFCPRFGPDQSSRHHGIAKHSLFSWFFTLLNNGFVSISFFLMRSFRQDLPSTHRIQLVLDSYILIDPSGTGIAIVISLIIFWDARQWFRIEWSVTMASICWEYFLSLSYNWNFLVGCFYLLQQFWL